MVPTTLWSNLATKRVYITSQNHGFMVDEASLPENDTGQRTSPLFDGSLQGFELKGRSGFLASRDIRKPAPVPHDIQPLFDRSLQIFRSTKSLYDR